MMQAHRIGVVHHKAGRWDAALAAYQRALAYCDTVRNCRIVRANIADVLAGKYNDIGDRRLKARDWAAAISAYHAALDYCQSSFRAEAMCAIVLDSLSFARKSYQAELRQAQRMSKLLAAQKRALEFQKDDRWEKAVSAWRVARSNCDRVERCQTLERSLARARAGLANQRGLKFLQDKNWIDAVVEFEEARRLCQKGHFPIEDCKIAQANLDRARNELRFAKEAPQRAQNISEAKQEIERILTGRDDKKNDDLAFLDPGLTVGPAQSSGNQTAAPATAERKYPEPPKPMLPLVPKEPDKQKVVADWAVLHLAAKAYDPRERPGRQPFADNADWQTLEIAAARATQENRAALKASGFNAFSYINKKNRTIVVAIEGSRLPDQDAISHPDTRTDVKQDWWINDVRDALIRGENPPQFQIAREYLAAIKRAYGNDYTIICAGHSLGGGACVYAAGNLGVRAVVINPISSGQPIPTKNAHLIENYVVEGELASTVYGTKGRHLIGAQYRIKNFRDTESKPNQVAGTIIDHGVERALDNLSKQLNIERLK